MKTQDKITGIILAAGRGSRMKGFTDNKPKCMLNLAGEQLITWQLTSLKKANINEILVVRGYLAESIQGNFNTVDNSRWAETNMVSSLLCALNVVKNRDVLISYGDIVYKSEHIIKLLTAKDDISITYDTKWENLWRLRNENPLDDAETFKQSNGYLVEIGNKAQSVDEVQGQYMGLLKFSIKGQEQLLEYLNSLEPSKVDKLDMTSLLQALLNNGIKIQAVPVNAGWCECDTQQDINIYEQELINNHAWEHDWR